MLRSVNGSCTVKCWTGTRNGSGILVMFLALGGQIRTWICSAAVGGGSGADGARFGFRPEALLDPLILGGYESAVLMASLGRLS